MQRVTNLILSRWFWLLAVLVLVISRFSTWLFPFDSDHWIFYYIGKKWAQGSILYVDMWDHKSPLIYGYNAIIHNLLGSNIFLHRVLFTVVAIIGIFLFYHTAKELGKQLKVKSLELSVRISTLLFIFVSNLAQFTNSGNNNENLVIPFLLGMTWCYLIYRRNPTKYQNALIASGILAGFVFFFKANFAILILPIVAEIIYINRKRFLKIISSLCLFGFGTVLQLLIWFVYFEKLHTFKQFFVASYEFNSKYIKALGWDLNTPGILIFIGILLLLLASFAPFIIRGLIGFAKPDKHIKYFLALISTSSLMFIILAGTFYSHYFLVVIPYMCLLFVAYWQTFFANRRYIKLFSLLIILLIMFTLNLKLGIYNFYKGSAASDLKSQKLAAEYVKQKTSKNDKIFANIYGATFYNLAKRDSGSRFISASHPLIDYKYRLGYNFNTRFIVDMEQAQTKYVVMSADKNDLYRTQNPVLMRYFLHNYHLETRVQGYEIYRRNE